MKDPEFNAEFIQRICADHANPRVCVETGTWKGQRTEIFAEVFDRVHTIEIDGDQMEETINRKPWDQKRIAFYLGDSCQLLPALAMQLNEPVFWYLDAHWFPGIKYKGGNAAPLFRELRAIASRPNYADTVVVDDVHAFMRKEWGDNPPPNVVSIWGETNQKNIEEVFDGRIHKSWIEHDKLFLQIKPGLGSIDTD